MPTDSRGVRCVGVSKTYATASGAVKALSAVDATFDAGEVTVVMGPSGSGKSSLLRVVAGLDRPDTGRVVVDGVDIGRLAGRRLRRVRRDLIGYVFQRPEENFIPYLTIDKNLQVLARAAPDRVDHGVLDALGIGDKRQQFPGSLSGGEQQRSALAQALLTRPPFVVADEPTAELDAHSARLLLDAISQASRDGVGFIIATHDPEVARIADRIIRIDSGAVSLALARDPRAPRRERLVAHGGRDASDESVLLSGERLSKSYRAGGELVRALDDVSLKLAAGELVAVMGPSGSGKTTLLNVLAGWERPDSGVISGHLASNAAPAWRDVSVVPQTLGLIDELTVEENVAFPHRMSGERSEGVRPLLQRLGVDHLAHRLSKEISLGEQQRCAIARAVVAAPRVLLADEPTAHQDAVSARRVFDALRERVVAGGCVVVATHDERLLDHADRVVTMAGGRIA